MGIAISPTITYTWNSSSLPNLSHLFSKYLLYIRLQRRAIIKYRCVSVVVVVGRKTLYERKYHDNMLNHELFFLLISKYCLKNVEVSDNVQYRYIYHFNSFFWPKPMSPSPIPFLCQNYGDHPGNGEYLNYFLLFSCPQHQWDKQSSSFLLWFLAFSH